MIICPISHETIPEAACLKCAHENRPAACGYDYILLKKVFRSADRTGIHATDLLGCPRRAYYAKMEPSPEYVSDMMTRTLGTLTHAILEDDRDGLFHSELSVSYQGVVGRVDLYYPESGDLIDLKTTRWLDKAKLPYGDHEMQVNIYGWMLEGMGYPVSRLFIQYIDMSGPTKCRSCKIPLRMDGEVLACPNCGNTPKNAHLGTALVEIEKQPAEEVGPFVCRKRNLLLSHMDEAAAPYAETSWLCQYCAHTAKCAEGQAYIKR